MKQSLVRGMTIICAILLKAAFIKTGLGIIRGLFTIRSMSVNSAAELRSRMRACAARWRWAVGKSKSVVGRGVLLGDDFYPAIRYCCDELSAVAFSYDSAVKDDDYPGVCFVSD